MNKADYLALVFVATGTLLASIVNLNQNARLKELEDFKDEIFFREACETAVLWDDEKVLVDTITVPDHLNEWQELILAIAYTESRFNPQAVGKDHDTGVLQLTPIYVREANRIAGADYELADAFDIEKSVKIFSIMQDHYNPEHDVEKAIRLHNRSPYYRREVLKNLEFIKKMEAVREAVKK